MADQNTFHLIIASVGETFFDGAASSATFPTSNGEITVLPHHEAFVTTLQAGKILVHAPSHEAKVFEVTSGVLEISANRATVLL
ncbi:MAG: F0F1 ATP synthase subunit epsilon [Candidatus Pacebacteria bacterium]|nr:F0F1 ATP synthase subunit epsilon [Candidatus Paceibacterota bacterium]